MDVTVWEYREHKGMPPNGERYTVLGYDEDNAPYILRWRPDENCWLAVGFQDWSNGKGFEPIVHLLRNENADKIKQFAILPLRRSELDGTPSPKDPDNG